MIVGTLIQDQHPMFRKFPTKNYADWQWWDILNYAKAMDLTNLRGLTPLVQSIDTYEFNRKLGIAFEANVDKGRLFVLCVDHEKQINERPATRGLLQSVREYVANDNLFRPEASLQAYEVDALFGQLEIKQDSKAESAAVKQLLNQ